MIGIADIAYLLLPQRVVNAPRAERLGVPLATLDRRIGVRQVARRAAEQGTSDLAVAAAEALFARDAVERDRVDCLVAVTQNPDGRGLPHSSALVHARLGLEPDCAVLDIGLGCSGCVYGLSIVSSFMQANGLRQGLLITADPYSKIVDPDDKRTALLFGDGAAATLLNDRPRWRLGRFDFGTEGRRAGSLKVDAGSGRLFMDGGAILQFSMGVVPRSLRRALDLNGPGPQQIDRMVLQGQPRGRGKHRRSAGTRRPYAIPRHRERKHRQFVDPHRARRSPAAAGPPRRAVRFRCRLVLGLHRAQPGAHAVNAPQGSDQAAATGRPAERRGACPPYRLFHDPSAVHGK